MTTDSDPTPEPGGEETDARVQRHRCVRNCGPGLREGYAEARADAGTLWD